MTISQVNAELVDNLATFFPLRTEPNVAWGNVGVFMQLPGLRGYWPMSSVDENGDAFDLSGQGRTLTNNAGLLYGVNSLAPYAIPNEASAQYLTRPDEAGLKMTEAMTAGGYFQNTPVTSAGLISKFFQGGAGNLRNYLLEHDSPIYRAYVSGTGTAGTTVSVTATVPTDTNWHLVIMRYTPSTELAIFVSDGDQLVKTVNTTSIPAVIFGAATTDFSVGMYDNGGNVMTGGAAQVFLSGVAISDLILNTLFYQTRALFGL